MSKQKQINIYPSVDDALINKYIYTLNGTQIKKILDFAVNESSSIRPNTELLVINLDNTKK